MKREQKRSAAFFTIEPEASGCPITPGGVEFLFDTWLGDDVVRAHPVVLVTTRVKNALLTLGDATGVDIVKAGVKGSAFFRKHNRGKRLPRFWALQIHGHAGRDDMGLNAAAVLVVSRRILDLLVEFRVGRATLAQYTSAREGAGQQALAPDGRRADHGPLRAARR
jgi:hypothetical protein